MITKKKYKMSVKNIDLASATKDIDKFNRASACVSCLEHKAFTDIKGSLNGLMGLIGYMYSATCLLATDKFRDFMYIFGHNTLLKVLEYYQSPQVEDYETCQKIVDAIKKHNELVNDNLKTTKL